MSNSVFKCICILLLVMPIKILAEVNIWYPNRGEMAYDGQEHILLNFEWTEPSSDYFWINYNPITGQQTGFIRGFELDLVIRNTFFESCVSDSGFANKYDDCPTAGVLESSNQWSFGCGTYQGIQFSIPQGSSLKHRHTCDFSFQRPSSATTTTDLGINAQIAMHKICPFDSIWCMDSDDNERLNNSNHNSSKYYIDHGDVYNDIWGNWPYSNNSVGALIIPIISTLIFAD